MHFCIKNVPGGSDQQFFLLILQPDEFCTGRYRAPGVVTKLRRRISASVDKVGSPLRTHAHRWCTADLGHRRIGDLFTQPNAYIWPRVVCQRRFFFGKYDLLDRTDRLITLHVWYVDYQTRSKLLQGGHMRSTSWVLAYLDSSGTISCLVALIRDTHTLRIDTYFQYVSQYAITYEYDT